MVSLKLSGNLLKEFEGRSLSKHPHSKEKSMKKYLVLVFLLISGTVFSQNFFKIVSISDSAFVYEKPSTESKIKGKIPKGTQVVSQESIGEYYQIFSQDLVSGGFVRKLDCEIVKVDQLTTLRKSNEFFSPKISSINLLTGIGFGLISIESWAVYSNLKDEKSDIKDVSASVYGKQFAELHNQNNSVRRAQYDKEIKLRLIFSVTYTLASAILLYNSLDYFDSLDFESDKNGMKLGYSITF